MRYLCLVCGAANDTDKPDCPRGGTHCDIVDAEDISRRMTNIDDLNRQVKKVIEDIQGNHHQISCALILLACRREVDQGRDGMLLLSNHLISMARMILNHSEFRSDRE